MVADDASPDNVFDVIVIGGGPAGENAAQYAIAGSARTAAIVEHELLGGECSYWACMPSKALLRPIEVAHTARNLSGIVKPVAIDAAELLRRRDSWAAHYSDAGQVRWAEKAGISVIRGRGTVSGERQVRVAGSDGERMLVAREAVVIATGTTAAVPAALADLQPWTSRDATAVKEVPESLVIVGGGVVACEAATWMAGLGCAVTMVVRGTVLSNFDPEVGERVTAGLRAAGVDVRTGATVAASRRDPVGATEVGRPRGTPVAMEVDGETITAAEILVATGRRPAVNDLGLETVGVDDPHELSGVDWLYAVGDASFGPELTHWGKYQARLVGDEIAARAEGRAGPSAPRDVPVPQVIFTDPEVAAVGLTADQARERGIGTTVVEVEFSSVAGAMLLRDDAAGFARLVIDTARNTVLGATFVGPSVGELIHSATVAIVGRVPIDVLWHAVPSYPTAAEVWLRLLEKLRGIG
ncbi:dihydrolipoyl dehydrogenase family protein [Jongsikchunia kroppenstedtii]|uniref:dihydrolipoyl dehydrogenase family protein n=1 Tax=Jongsikchunia kroppenstedtii TaxID=1121721 RepID=UPI00037774B7|nr:NAD(P)/FAD-dependent oxidoreductase [Jongsikchunia kroppenstedtii]